MRSTDQIFEILRKSQDKNYIGEELSQLQHSLQSAYFAKQAKASSAEVLAALLHDIGHLCDPNSETMGDYGVENHEKVGADFLRNLGCSEDVATLVEGHVQAKRYLTAVNPAYLEKLSDASRKTLEYQGGPMSQEEATKFKANPSFDAILRIRAWDERAKEKDLKVPELESYRSLFDEYFK